MNEFRKLISKKQDNVVIAEQATVKLCSFSKRRFTKRRREMEDHGDIVIGSKAIIFLFVKDSHFAFYVACNPCVLYNNEKNQPFVTVMDHKEMNDR